ncbi:large conductance mechanosensitive channel protein MscL [Chelatococcus reniformis]|uniref:Large-conductance mechanosensitive channel n=1 Tax=Chelatococcus reniformis TaxID=1494448 RepID=A0A916UT10_9HYPH|nr:large conductance mechanosensitive channel protein MscL [Chelatococcus reniformis]GGC83545.1 large-conductance mechanosensitive channel [Chelatococcus reniformis]
MFNEFKKFAMRGNVVDLAIGVVIGAAFGNIVNSLVADVFMPIIGWITGGLDFSNYFVKLGHDVTALSYEDAKKQGAVIGYGRFITLAVNFLIVAWVLFLVVRGINRLRAAEPEPEKVEEAPADIKLLAEIRDLLAERGTPAPAPIVPPKTA